MVISIKKTVFILISITLCFFIFYCKKTENPISQKSWTTEDKNLIINELNRTTNELMVEIEHLSEAQWNFRESPEKWSINEIVEHLEVQNELHFRQLTVVANIPAMPKFVPVVKDWDHYFSNYATDTLKRQAKWFLEPIGRFCSKAESVRAFKRVRHHLLEFVEKTDVDLRKHFSFSKNIQETPLNEIKPKEILDLHQLLLLGIAHTDRHLRQIRGIKKLPEYLNLE